MLKCIGEHEICRTLEKEASDSPRVDISRKRSFKFNLVEKSVNEIPTRITTRGRLKSC
jgi:hypothetical protein